MFSRMVFCAAASLVVPPRCFRIADDTSRTKTTLKRGGSGSGTSVLTPRMIPMIAATTPTRAVILDPTDLGFQTFKREPAPPARGPCPTSFPPQYQGGWRAQRSVGGFSVRRVKTPVNVTILGVHPSRPSRAFNSSAPTGSRDELPCEDGS